MRPRRYSVKAAIAVPLYQTALFAQDGVRFLVTHSGGYSYAVALEPVEGEVGWYMGVGRTPDDLFTLTRLQTDGDQQGEWQMRGIQRLEAAMELAVDEVVG